MPNPIRVQGCAASASYPSAQVSNQAAGAGSKATAAHSVSTDASDHGLTSSAPSHRQVASHKRQTRSPQNRERLGRLRLELGKISPAPSGREEARQEIVKALARAGLGAWTVPELTDDKATRYADASVRINLLAHVIFINPTGSFRIVDLHTPREPYFEMPGADGRTFVLPPGQACA